MQDYLLSLFKISDNGDKVRALGHSPYSSQAAVMTFFLYHTYCCFTPVAFEERVVCACVCFLR